MGLLYLFPTSIDEKEFVQNLSKENFYHLKVKSYGLPIIFWLYALAILTILILLSISIYSAAIKLFITGTSIDKILVIALVLAIAFSFVSVFVLLYFQIHLESTPEFLKIEYRPFGLKIYSKKIQKEQDFHLSICHFMDSANIARLNQDERFKNFQNKGHFELRAICKNKNVLLDRSSRKKDLEDLKNILSPHEPNDNL